MFYPPQFSSADTICTDITVHSSSLTTIIHIHFHLLHTGYPTPHHSPTPNHHCGSRTHMHTSTSLHTLPPTRMHARMCKGIPCALATLLQSPSFLPCHAWTPPHPPSPFRVVLRPPATTVAPAHTDTCMRTYAYAPAHTHLRMFNGIFCTFSATLLLTPLSVPAIH